MIMSFGHLSLYLHFITCKHHVINTKTLKKTVGLQSNYGMISFLKKDGLVSWCNKCNK